MDVDESTWRRKSRGWKEEPGSTTFLGLLWGVLSTTLKGLLVSNHSK